MPNSVERHKNKLFMTIAFVLFAFSIIGCTALVMWQISVMQERAMGNRAILCKLIEDRQDFEHCPLSGPRSATVPPEVEHRKGPKR